MPTQELVKLSIMINKLDTLSHEEFHDYWENKHPEIWLSVAVVRAKIVRYAQHHVSEPVATALRAQGLPVAAYDGVVQMYARSVEDLMSVFQDPEYLRVVVPDEEKFLKRDQAVMLIGREVVKFEQEGEAL